MRYPARVLLVAVLVVALASGVGVGGGESAPLETADTPSLVAETSVLGSETVTDRSVDRHAIDRGPHRAQVATFDRQPDTDIRIDLRPDRDARWAVVVRYELTDANETAVFESVGDRFVDGEIGPSATLFERLADGASRNADREMRIEDVDRTVEVHDDVEEFDVDEDAVVAVGELRLTFVWTEFLAADGETLVLGDALTTPTNDTWLRSLGEGQSIEIATPDGYSVSGTPGATVSLRDNAVIIDGPRAFDDEERVAVVYSPTGTVGSPPWTMLTVGIVLAALLIAVGLLGYRRVGSGGGSPAVGSDGSDPKPGTGSAADADGGVETGTDGMGGSAADGSEADLSLLSDEERVERLLDRRGGRMRQADIVAETGWSDAKVSQLLSTMAADDRVEKLRLGRENLISLPDGDDPGVEQADGMNSESR
ncbi:helix-turn-helix transcriptional regulator [Halorubrum sp. DTA98]|uniref:helix-turn-helix transcriptional regulator n=1 Tax=Halorubrum sp. DTA98 TaxID=3402163 RepID=UPI003AAD350A